MPSVGKSNSKTPLKATRQQEASEDEVESNISDELSIHSEEASELDNSDVDSQVEELGESEDDYNEGELDFSEDEMEQKRKGLEDLLTSAKSGALQGDDGQATAPSKNRGSGVVYLSWIPPLMKAKHLRSYLSDYGDVDRIWIEMPDAIKNAKGLSKKKLGKLERSLPKEAWVEFVRAKKAYKAAKMLHATPIGRGLFKEHMWSIKYLKNFSWSDLVTQHLHRKKLRDERLRQSLSRAKQAATKFLDNRNKQDRIDNSKKRKRSEEPVEEEQVIPRTIKQQTISSRSTTSELLDNSLLSKVRLNTISYTSLAFDDYLHVLTLRLIFWF